MKFAPLHIISGYSFLQSGLTIEKIAAAIKNNDYFGVGLTDNGVLFGAAEFVKYAKKIEKPFIIGMNITLEKDNLSLFVIDEAGYRNIMAIMQEFQEDKLNLSFLKEHGQGLIAVLETKSFTFKEKFEAGINSSFTKYLLNYNNAFNGRFYLGIEVTSKEDVSYANNVRKFASEYTYQCVAFPKIRYVKKDDAIVIDIVDAIANGTTLKKKSSIGQEYFMNENDYRKIYTTSEMANTIEIVKSSQFDLNIKRGEMLHYPCEDSSALLDNLCQTALTDKHLDDDKHKERLAYELKIINEMGYADYFLLVQDYVNWSKNHDIVVGPGRGSAAGSLVAYLLNITEIDPLVYDLQFERFLNPYRKTMPDIDVDFMDTKRDDAVQYVREKYGQEKVGNIVTFQSILAKQALRDIGRVYEYPTRHIDLLSKSLSDKKMDLRSSYVHVPEFKKLVDSDPYFLEIVSLASKIENLPRQNGMHAAGVVLNNTPLKEAIPVSLDFNNNYIAQYEMQYLEEQGFLKMDFLGLRNLTMIDYCVKLINQNHPDAHLTPYNIPYDDKNIFDLISSGNTIGLFQIDTAPMKRAIKILQPDCFKDVVALLALDRPGPMKYIPNYAKRKVGKEKIEYIANELEPFLKDTYGIILYQEQINHIARTIAGFSMGEADMFRRAISKKDKDKLINLEQQFTEGALKNGYTKSQAKKFFDDILLFANYGFNKSHSVVYCVITCRMAWLKYYYPLEFYAAILEIGSSASDAKFEDYASEILSRNIKILPPSVNNSAYSFTIENNALRFPLTAIKGIDQSFTKMVMEERKHGEFKNFFDFVTRMFPYSITSKQVENLINAGAFDEFYSSRTSLNKSIMLAMQYAELNCTEDGQMNLGIAPMPLPSIIEAQDDPFEILEKEYEAIGLRLSANPIQYKRDDLDAIGVNKISSVVTNKKVTICGIIKSVKTIRTKKSTTMAFVKIYDESGEIEMTVFPKVFEESISFLKKNEIVIVSGRLENNEESTFVADSIKLMED